MYYLSFAPLVGVFNYNYNYNYNYFSRSAKPIMTDSFWAINNSTEVTNTLRATEKAEGGRGEAFMHAKHSKNVTIHLIINVLLLVVLLIN